MSADTDTELEVIVVDGCWPRIAFDGHRTDLAEGSGPMTLLMVAGPLWREAYNKP